MASYSVCQPVITSVGRAGAGLVVSSHSSSQPRHIPSSATVSSASYRRDEAARMCCAAARKTRSSAGAQLVSQFWSVDSRRALRVKTMLPLIPVAMSRPGSHLVVVS